MKGPFNKFWSPEDVATLIDLYPSTLNSVIAEKLKKKESSIIAKAFKLRLRKPLEFIRAHTCHTSFKKGHVPMNKGKKQGDYMTSEAIEKTKGTRFKKGNIPVNSYNEVGKITIRYDHKNRGGKAYKYVCLELGKWQPLHKHLWELENGIVPAGYCLWFKDGNTLNTDLGNLELITRKENWKRNHPSKLLPEKYVANCIAWRDKELKEVLIENHPEIIELKRHQLKLNQTINGKL